MTKTEHHEGTAETTVAAGTEEKASTTFDAPFTLGILDGTLVVHLSDVAAFLNGTRELVEANGAPPETVALLERMFEGIVAVGDHAAAKAADPGAYSEVSGSYADSMPGAPID
jgi:hypothetical protein